MLQGRFRQAPSESRPTVALPPLQTFRIHRIGHVISQYKGWLRGVRSSGIPCGVFGKSIFAPA